MNVSEAKECRHLQKESTRLKKVVADRAQNIQILKEAASINF